MKVQLLLLSLLTAIAVQAQDFDLEAYLKEDSLLNVVFSQPDKFQAQLIYTQIDRTQDNTPQFTSYTLGVTPTRYFYPASTVKMPTAFLALEKLNQLNLIHLDKTSVMLTGAGRSPQTAATVDLSAKSGLPSVEQYVKKIFLVSDNDAYNRLYEFLGQAGLNEQLQTKGFEQTRIIHRLSVSGYDVEGNRHTNPVSFLTNDQLTYHQGQRYSIFKSPLQLQNELAGKAYMNSEDKIVNEPFDFRYKNFVALQDLHDMLKTVLFPLSVPEKQRFNLTAEDYQFLYKMMSMYPRESQHPKYEKESDDYVKFYLYNAGKDTLPDHIRVFNKVGWAYGFLTDVSYIIDFEKGIEFMVAAVIHVNENETYNDGVYEYDEIGMPFFRQIGKRLMDYETTRKRPNPPNLSRFSIEQYD